jgi:hypothetical protein
MTEPSTLRNPLPDRPRLVFRVGFAGNREVPEEMHQRLIETLAGVFRTVAQRLAEIAPGTPVAAGTRPRIARYYSQETPLLRLITGLAEGTDTFAAQALDRAVDDDSHIAAELAAVLPFDLAAYRASRNAEFRADFDRQAARCAYILTLDGLYEKPDPDTPLARHRRARAYRSQSALLLRHSDLLVAAANPAEAGRAGGTMETVRAALAFDLPVVLLHTGTAQVWLIEPGDDLDSVLAESPREEAQWKSMLHGWITDLVVASDPPPPQEFHHTAGPAHELSPTHGDKLLEEFFSFANIPPLAAGQGGKPKRKPTFREQCWSRFDGLFRPHDIQAPKSDPWLEPYATIRSRATDLNYHYSGLYRGAFVLNYTLAVCAVFLAALSLVLLGLAHSQRLAAEDAAPQAAWLVPVLLLLGAGKLWIVVWIYRNTHQANHGDWNDKAVDYRYLAERLRTMFYLPRIGSFQPPAAGPPHYVCRVVRQSAVDWLFDAFTRSISPAQLSIARKETIKDSNGTPHGEAKWSVSQITSRIRQTFGRGRWTP